MTVSASRNQHDQDHGHDFLESGKEEPARRWPSPSLLVAVAAALLLAAALVVQVARDSDSGGASVAVPVTLEGSLSLSNFRSDSFGDQRGWGDNQERNATGSGTVLLAFPEREVQGAAQVAFEASYTGDHANGYFHSWGDITLHFGSPTVTCRGSFGWSNLKDPPEGGGSMHARCDDGALLAATMIKTQQVPGIDPMTINLRNGWYVAGPQQQAD